MFENPEIAPDALPTADEIDWQPLDPRYVTRLQSQALLAGLGALAALLIIGLSPLPIADVISPRVAPVALIIVVAAGFGWPAISVPRKRYAIRDRDILYRSGILRHSVSAIPFNRIQHVETSSTPLDRRFRLATLKVYTAGGSGGDLKIHGLPAAVAERLRVFVLARVGGEAERD